MDVENFEWKMSLCRLAQPFGQPRAPARRMQCGMQIAPLVDLWVHLSFQKAALVSAIQLIPAAMTCPAVI
jgi:hypothetical protein